MTLEVGTAQVLSFMKTIFFRKEHFYTDRPKNRSIQTLFRQNPVACLKSIQACIDKGNSTPELYDQSTMPVFNKDPSLFQEINKAFKETVREKGVTVLEQQHAMTEWFLQSYCERRHGGATTATSKAAAASSVAGRKT